MKLQFVLAMVIGLVATAALLPTVPVAQPPAAAAQAPSVAQPQSIGQPQVVAAVNHDTSPPLRTMFPAALAAPQIVATPVGPAQQRTQPLGMRPGLEAAAAAAAAAASHDPAVQRTQRAPAAPAPSRSFDGLSDTDNQTVTGFRFVPSDANGDVGPSHYIQMVNKIFAIYDKNGTKVFPPGAPGTKLSSLFAGFGGLCETSDGGDPIVLYDPLANRWLLSQFAVGAAPPSSSVLRSALRRIRSARTTATPFRSPSSPTTRNLESGPMLTI